MKRILGLFTLGLSLLVAGLAQASPLPPPFDSGRLAKLRADAIEAQRPYAFLVVDQDFIDLSDRFRQVGESDQSRLLADVDFHGVKLSLDVLVDPDPFISFGAASNNNIAGPVTYSFLFGTPVVSGPYNNATSTTGISLTNGASGTATVDIGAIYATYLSGYAALGQATPTNLGVDLGTGAVVSSGAPFQVTTTHSFGTASNSFAPTTFDHLEALLTYTQTDVGSVAAWSGAVTLNIPEPATGVVLMTVLGLAAAGRRSGLVRR